MDDGWKPVEVEPEAVGINGNGHHADGIGPTVELVLDTGHHANGNGHAAVEVNGNGPHDEATEPQQTLGGVHGRGASEAEGPQAEASVRHPLDIRVGTDRGTGAGERAGRRGALGHNTQGEVVAASAAASPWLPMYAALFAFQQGYARVRAVHRALT